MSFIPKYIKQQVNNSPRSVVTSDRWNELWNLLITQGDYNSETLHALINGPGADNIGATAVGDGTATTVQGILEEIDADVTALNGAVVHKSGNETIQGFKTFVKTTNFQEGVTFGDATDVIRADFVDTIGAWGVRVGTENGNSQGGLFIGAGSNDNGGTESKKLLRVWDKESWKQVWHEDNDGHTSGLDADTLDGKHNSDMVHIAGTETITGTKTFSTAPVVPTPTADGNPATKKYADDIASARYTKTNMQTSGQALLHWDNLTNVPNLADDHWKTPVANQAALPVTGNSLGDNRVVLDDGDGKQAVYTCVATTGTYTQQWSKVGDVDWMTEESTRQTQETARVNAEGTESPKSGRVGAELDRVDAENARVLAEGTADPKTGRVGAELDRVDAEEAREIAEGLRQAHINDKDNPHEVRAAKAARFVVGTSTAGWTAKDCDYLCDGTADDVEINNAITALPATGGEIVILDGTYNITTDIIINKSNTNIRGSGKSTILKRMFDNTSIGGVVNVSFAKNCRVDNISIDGNKSTYTATFNCGIYSWAANKSIFSKNFIYNNYSGIYLYSNDNVAILENDCNNNTTKGIEINHTNNKISVCNNVCEDNETGIFLYESDYNVINGNKAINNSSKGISLSSSDNNVVSMNILENNYLLLMGSQYNLIDGNICPFGTSSYTIYLFSTGNNYNFIINNNCFGQAPTIGGGTGNNVYGNKYDDSIDVLTTTQIANTLTETAEGKVLDARQGKALKDLVSTNTQFTDIDETVYNWKLTKSSEGIMQIEYEEVV